jgi:3-mercaptopropionate dioxygenase
MSNIARFREFVQSFTKFVERVRGDEERVFVEGKALLSEIIVHDDWLPEQFAKPDPELYRQYLLYCDPMERFSVVSFVWGPGQKTPVHDHTVWGMVGVMCGVELCEQFNLDPATGRLISGGTHEVSPGESIWCLHALGTFTGYRTPSSIAHRSASMFTART